MKVFALFFLFALAYGQEAPTVTEDLVAAQDELTIGHEFAEIFLVQNREILSDYLEIIEEIALDSFMDAYTYIKNEALATREAMDEYESSFCKDAIRNRYELQISRFGQKLSQCLGTTNGYLNQFTGILNGLHDESRDYTNRIPNSSLQVLSELDIFTGRDNLRNYINNVYRDLFFRARDWHREFEEFVAGISLDLSALLEQYTECYRTLPRTFENESAQDLESIRLCYGD